MDTINPPTMLETTGRGDLVETLDSDAGLEQVVTSPPLSLSSVSLSVRARLLTRPTLPRCFESTNNASELVRLPVRFDPLTLDSGNETPPFDAVLGLLLERLPAVFTFVRPLALFTVADTFASAPVAPLPTNHFCSKSSTKEWVQTPTGNSVM
jgi:hypothetical protein